MKAHMLTTLENSRGYTLAVANAMPESGYDTKPAEGIWNFRELLSHIGYGIYWWEANFIKRTETPWNPPAAKSNQKQVMEYLNGAYDSLKATIGKTDMTDDLAKGFMATIDHITHHRGQAVVYLRHQGITPPEYVY